MPRVGWNSAPVLDGWVQIVRRSRSPSRTSGPSPKIGQLTMHPRNSKRRQSAAGEPTKQQQKSTWDVPSANSQSPSRQSFRRGHRRGASHRLEAALSALGTGNPLAKRLVALRIARSKAKVLPLEEQIIACKKFVERTRKRVSRVWAVISRALEKEVQEGEARLQQLKESQSQHTGDAAASVTELQRRIDDLTRERDSLRAATPRVPRCVDGKQAVGDEVVLDTNEK